MEGYSVTEAASVLGVPTERVWELLARGVLSGAPEGETGMRVYLQPRPAPAPPEAKRPNGNGRRDEPELSPFRELLTEFRGLTERYGQALLALGEARGEVATLRSRVDLLEARMDLRLPHSAPSPAASWASTPMPFPTERAVVPTVPAPHEQSPAEEHEAEEEEPRSRKRGPRRATESFAEALARAEDPSIPELPGAAETAAMATLRAETDAALPRDLPSADAVPVAEEPDTAVAAAHIEVQEAAVEDFGATAPVDEPVTDVSDAPADVAPAEIIEDVAEEAEDRPSESAQPIETDIDGAVSAGGEDADVVADQVPDIDVEEQPAEIQDIAVAPRQAESAEPVESRIDTAEAVGQEAVDVVTHEAADIDVEEPAAETQEVDVAPRQAEPAVEAEPVSTEEAAPEPSVPTPLEWDTDRYTTAIEEPDWFAAEVIETKVEDPTPTSVALARDADLRMEPVAELAVVADAEPELTDPVLEPAAETPAAEEPTAAAVETTAAEDPTAAEEPTAAAPSEESDEETMLWFGRAAEDSGGASEMEVATTGAHSPVEITGAAAPAFPGSSELDAALAALGVPASGQDQPTAESAAADRVESEPASVADADEWPPRSAFMESYRPSSASTSETGSTASSASRAYRRLRRIFPG